MSDIPSINQGKIQEQETQFKAGVSEYTARRIGSNVNFVLTEHIFDHTFKINGPMASFNGKLGVDGLFIFERNATILDVIIYRHDPGTSGGFSADIKLSTFPSGAWTSILTTIPTIGNAAAAYSSCGVGDSVSGCTAAVLNSGLINVSAKTRLRMDVTGVEGGAPKTGGITIKYIYR